MKIIPAILPSSYRAIEDGVEKVHYSAKTIQIDFVDGHFAANRTWWFNNKDKDRLSMLLNQDEGLPYWQEMNYEFDLMVKDPLEYIDTFIALGPSKIIFHIESMEAEKMIPYFETLPSIARDVMTFGIAIGIDTDPNLVEQYKEHISSIQCMGIATVGFQGQPFDEEVVKRISFLKKECRNIDIQVDGSMNPETMLKVKNAGATCAVIGSYLFKTDDVRGTIEKLKISFG